MKILHIIDHIALGGAQSVVKGFFDYQKDNKDIYLFSLRKENANIGIDHENVFVYKSSQKYSLIPLKEIREIIKEEKIDVLHCHLFRSQVFGWILKKFYFPDIKLIIHEHGKIFQKNWYYKLFMRVARKKVNLFIAVSYTTKKELMNKANIPEEKIKVLYNFVDLEKFNRKNITWNIEKEKEKLGIKKDEFVIGFVGRLVKVKGCEYLIRALPYLKFKYKVVIAGDGPLKKKLENLAEELGVTENVIFLGYTENIVKTYSLMDCSVVSSLLESFGLAAIEAQAIEIPVIVSDIPALNETINSENGLFFKIEDFEDLAAQINKLRDGKLRKQLVKNGLENVQRFGLDNYIEELNKIYKEI